MKEPRPTSEPILVWTVEVDRPLLLEDVTHYANFGRGRYTVKRSPRAGVGYVARWHRSRRPQNRGENIGSTPKLEAAKTACERHAASRDA